jgi:WD40 repeat protein
MKNFFVTILIVFLLAGCKSFPLNLPPSKRISTTPTSLSGGVISPENANRMTSLVIWNNPPYTDPEYIISFSPGGYRLATSSSHSVTIRDVTSLTPIQRFDTGTANIISPDWSLVAAVSNNDAPEYMMLYDFADGDLLKQWDPIGKYNYSINEFSPDGSVLAQMEMPGNVIHLWSMPSGIFLRDIQGNGTFSNALAFSPDGKTIASTYWDMTSSDSIIHFWDVESGTELEPLQTSAITINYLTFSPDGKTLAILDSGSNNLVTLWDRVSGKQGPDLGITHYIDPLSGVQTYSQMIVSGWPVFSPDGKVLAVGSWDVSGTTLLIDTATGDLLTNLNTGGSGTSGLAFSSDGTKLAISTNDGTLSIWGVGSSVTPLATITATITPSPLQLPLTTQPKCWTILASSVPDPNEIIDLHQSEIIFDLKSTGSIQTLVNEHGNYVIEQLQINEFSIRGKKVTLENQQLSNGFLQTIEFGRVVILTADWSGSCMVMVVTPDQFDKIEEWLDQ